VRGQGIADRFVRVAGSTRVNIKIVDHADTTDINMDGMAADETDLAARSPRSTPLRMKARWSSFRAACRLPVRPTSMPISCPGCVRDGARVVLDTSGAR
jgi:1-phosphofructokinase